MAVTDADFKALQDRVTALETDGTGGWGSVINQAWKRIEPFVTPILVAASAAAVLWFNNLNHVTTTAAIANVQAQSQANAEKVAEVKVVADKVVDQSQANSKQLERVANQVDRVPTPKP